MSNGVLLLALVCVSRVAHAGPDPGRKIVVVVDPGHGGEDYGGKGPGGIFEKEITLRVAEALKKSFSDQTACTVLVTRDSDVRVTRDERAVFANRPGVVAFVSIHCGFSHRGRDSGSMVYYYKPDGQDASLNQPIRGMAGDREIVMTPLTTAQVEAAGAGEKLAKLVCSSLSDRGGLTDGPVGGQIAVLSAARAPAVLVEVGFLSNSEDERRMMDPSQTESLCRSLRDAVVDFIRSAR